MGCIFDGRSGVWAAACDDPDADVPVWSRPRRIADGVMMNKPTVLADGSWLLPVSLWSCYPDKIRPELEAVSRANLLHTADGGATFGLIVGPRIAHPPHRSFDEHMVVERGDGSWWMLIRSNAPGIHESLSHDRGRTWSEPVPSQLGGPSSRFALRRLGSGKLALVNHRTAHRLPGEEPAKAARRGGNRRFGNYYLNDAFRRILGIPLISQTDPAIVGDNARFPVAMLCPKSDAVLNLSAKANDALADGNGLGTPQRSFGTSYLDLATLCGATDEGKQKWAYKLTAIRRPASASFWKDALDHLAYNHNPTVPNGYFNGYENAPLNAGITAYRHGDRSQANFSFFDGHVEALKWSLLLDTATRDRLTKDFDKNP